MGLFFKQSKGGTSPWRFNEFLNFISLCIGFKECMSYFYRLKLRLFFF